jgi:Folate-dependent phosphoribosylglycinamide formyltransferase PurN
MFKIGVMASGGGSNFKAIIDRIGEGDLDAQCKFLISNNGNCGAMEHARAYGIPVYPYFRQDAPGPGCIRVGYARRVEPLQCGSF